MVWHAPDGHVIITGLGLECLVPCTPSYNPILIHRYFRTEETGDSVLMIPVGNVTADTELTYEYGVRTEKNHSATTTSDQEKGELSS